MHKHFKWLDNCNSINWQELSNLYKIAPLGDKSPDKLELVFNNSMFKYFVYDDEKLVGVIDIHQVKRDL